MIKLLLISVVLNLSLSGFGQIHALNLEDVDTIIISSNLGSYQFDDKGTTISKSENLTIIFSEERGGFIINNHIKETKKTTIEPSSINKKSYKQSKTISNNIHDSLIIGLLEAFNLISDLKRAEYLPEKELANYVNKKSIKTIAKLREVDWHFKNQYSTKQMNEEFFKSCQSIDTLSLYLSERFDTLGYVMITDYSNTIHINVIAKGEKFVFEGKYPNPIYQPWYFHNNETNYKITPILDLKINLILEKILPKGFLNRGMISKEALFNDYINWYFERKGL